MPGRTEEESLHICAQTLQARPLNDVCKVWADVDRSRIRAIGLGDSPAIARDLYVSAAQLLSSTRRLELFLSVTNPVSRDISVTATAVGALKELHPRREITVVVGTGDSALWGVGLDRATVATLSHYVQSLRALFATGHATYQRRDISISWVAGLDVRVFIACAGPRTLAVAAEHADGALVSLGFSDAVLESCEAVIRSVRRRVERPLDLWWNSTLVLDTSREAALARSFGDTASWLTRGSADAKLIPIAIRPGLTAINERTTDLEFVYGDHRRGEVLLQLARDHGVYDWLVERSAGFFGNRDDIANRFDYWRERGMHRWVIYLGGADQNVDRAVQVLDSVHTSGITR